MDSLSDKMDSRSDEQISPTEYLSLAAAEKITGVSQDYFRICVKKGYQGILSLLGQIRYDEKHVYTSPSALRSTDSETSS